MCDQLGQSCYLTAEWQWVKHSNHRALYCKHDTETIT